MNKKFPKVFLVSIVDDKGIISPMYINELEQNAQIIRNKLQREKNKICGNQDNNKDFVIHEVPMVTLQEFLDVQINSD